MGSFKKNDKNGSQSSLKIIFDPYNEDSYTNSPKEYLQHSGIIPNSCMGADGAIHESSKHDIYIFRISALTSAIKYISNYIFPTDDSNAKRYAVAFYDKRVFDFLTSDNDQEYHPIDSIKISYFVHNFGCVTNLQAYNNALNWLIVPRELFDSEKQEEFVYLFLCFTNKSQPRIFNYKFPTDTPFYWDYPVATSLIYDESKQPLKLSESSILLGSVRILSSQTNLLEVVNGEYEWLDENKELINQSEHCVIYNQKTKYKISKGEYYDSIPLDVYVYSQKNLYNSVNAFVWCSGNEDDLIKKSYIQDYYINNSEQISSKYIYVLDSLSLNTIFDSYIALTRVSYDSFARYIIKSIVKQPIGFRSISIEGNLARLMGGALHKIAEILIDAKKEKRELTLEEYYQISSLFSMNGSYLWYDSPINPLDELKPKKNDSNNISNKDLELKAKTDMSFYLRDVLGIQKGSNGCESLKTLIYGIFKILQSYDIDIDYVYCDIETIFNDARTLNVRRFDENIENALKKYTSISKRIDNRDIIYNDIIYTELQNRKDIWDNITQRGYFFDNSKLNDIKKVSSGNGSEYYGIANAKSYEHRRNINVWDAVMKTYENDLFYDYIFKPILSLEKYKLTKCSSNSRFEAKGYINRANMFETYLGGSVSVNENMYSSIPLYEDYVSEGYKKLSMDNWKTLPKQLDNIFQFFVGHINRIRGTELSSRGKFNVFFASWNIWAFELNKRIKFRKNNTSKDSYLEQISKLYYQELLYHIFLSCPDKAIAYFIIETKRDVADIQYYIDLVTDDIKSIYSIEYICHYYTNCYENLSQILSNFNKKTGGANLTSLNKTLAIEPYPFVISGVTNNDNNIWRITCDSQFKLEINDTENPSISINGKNIKFSSGNISSDDDNDTKIGCWITTPKDVFPVIETEADYYSQINPVYKTQNITDFPDYRTYTLFGELPKNHAVSLRFNLSQFNKYYARLLYSGVLKPLEVILGYENDTFDNQIKDIPFYIKGAGENYNIINLKPNNDYILQLFITIAEINTEGFNLSATYKLFDCKNSDFSNILIDETLENITYKPDNNIIHFLMSGLKIVSPESSLKGVDKDNFLKHFNIKEFKIYHSGFNVKTEIFKTHNGINYSRVNKRIPAYSDMPVCSKKGDTYIAKISWLNATNNDIDCKLIFNVNSNQFNIEKNLITFTNDGSVIFNDDFNSNQKLIISSNSEGYLFIKLPVIMSEETTFSLSLHY